MTRTLYCQGLLSQGTFLLRFVKLTGKEVVRLPFCTTSLILPMSTGRQVKLYLPSALVIVGFPGARTTASVALNRSVTVAPLTGSPCLVVDLPLSDSCRLMGVVIEAGSAIDCSPDRQVIRVGLRYGAGRLCRDNDRCRAVVVRHDLALAELRETTVIQAERHGYTGVQQGSRSHRRKL